MAKRCLPFHARKLPMMASETLEGPGGQMRVAGGGMPVKGLR
jgi:hypothetical protein